MKLSDLIIKLVETMAKEGDLECMEMQLNYLDELGKMAPYNPNITVEMGMSKSKLNIKKVILFD